MTSDNANRLIPFDPIQFIANVLLVVKADGKMTPREQSAIERLRVANGIKKSDLSAAMKKVAAGSIAAPVPVGTWADQVKNLEAMLEAACADNDWADEEKPVIAGFCEAIAITQDQLNRLIAEVEAKSAGQALLCPACKAPNASGARFCSACGAPLESGAAVPLAFNIPKTGVAIEFAESASIGFPDALREAGKADALRRCERGRNTWFLAEYHDGDLLRAAGLASHLSPLRHKKAWLNGSERPWNELFGWASCALARQESYNPSAYCFGGLDDRVNPWGCKACGWSWAWADWNEWMCFGAWEQDPAGRGPVWRFDKHRIAYELNAKLMDVRQCPYFVPGLAEAFLSELPDAVSPMSDPNWGFRHVSSDTPGAIQVRLSRGEGAFAWTDEIWTNGVCPEGGLGLYRKLLARAVQSLSINSAH